jgi:hypothetical protein
MLGRFNLLAIRSKNSRMYFDNPVLNKKGELPSFKSLAMDALHTGLLIVFFPFGT